MVETLVALLILSLGLLGLAALQSTSMKSTHSAYLRTQATHYAHDMLDRLRAHRKLARAQAFDLALTDSTPACVPTAHVLPACHLMQWRDDLSTLPAGTGAVDYDPATQMVTVIVQWHDQRAGGSATEQIRIQSRL